MLLELETSLLSSSQEADMDADGMFASPLNLLWVGDLCMILRFVKESNISSELGRNSDSGPVWNNSCKFQLVN